MDRETQKILTDVTSSINGLNKMTGALGKFLNEQKSQPKGSTATAAGKAKDARDEALSKQAESNAEAVMKAWDTTAAIMTKSSRKVSDSFHLLASNSEKAGQSMLAFSKELGGPVLGTIIGGIAETVGSLKSTYLDLSASGANFSDSLFDLAHKALETGTSLDEYARINKNNAKVAAAMAGNGRGGLAGLASQVRKNSEQFGMFNYSVQGLDDVVGSVAETYRLSGHAQDLGSKSSVEAMMRVAGQADVLASQFGKSRDEILKTAMEAQRDEVYLAKLSQMSAGEAAVAGRAFGSSIMALAAQSGEAGKMLSKMLAQTASFDGRAYNTDAARQLFQKVFPQGIEMMTKLYTNINADKANAAKYTADYIKQMKSGLANERENLARQAEGFGETAERARAMLRMYSELQDLTDDQIEKQAKINDLQGQLKKPLDNFVLGFQNIWMRFSSGVLLKFLPMIEKPMESIAVGVQKFLDSDGFKNLSASVGLVGERLNAWIKRLTTDQNMTALSGWINTKLTEFANWINQGSGTGLSLTKVLDGVESTAKGLWTIIDGTATVIGKLGPMFSWVANNIGTLAKAAGAAAIVLGGLKAFSMAQSLMSMVRGMNVTAQSVFVNGKNLGGGLPGRGGPHGRAGGGGGRGGRFGKIAGVLGGIAVAGVTAYEGLGLVGNLFGKEAEQRQRAIDNLSQANDAQEKKLNEADHLDDLTRQTLKFRANHGWATEEEKKKLEADAKYRQERDGGSLSRAQLQAQSQGNSEAAMAARDMLSRMEGDNAPVGQPRDPETTGSVGSAATATASDGPGLMSTLVGGLTEAMGGKANIATGVGGAIAGAVGGVIKSDLGKAARWILPGAETALQAGYAAQDIWKWVKGEQSGGQTFQNVMGEVIDGAIDLIPGKLGKVLGVATTGLGMTDHSIGQMIARGVSGGLGMNSPAATPNGTPQPGAVATPRDQTRTGQQSMTDAARRLAGLAEDAEADDEGDVTVKEALDKLNRLMEQMIAQNQRLSDEQIRAIQANTQAVQSH